jgi:alpha-beta hydrolase superfamily lysophospholipase
LLKYFVKIILLFLTGLSVTACNHLLYPASRLPFVDPVAIIPQPIDLTIFHNPENKTSYIHAWYFKNKTPIKKGVVLHFHGNGQNLTTHFMFFKWVIQHGYDYIIFDYRGYGVSSDSNANQQKTVEDGIAAIKYVKENFKNDKIITIGQSLGSNVLVRSLQEINKSKQTELLPDLVVLDSSFLSYQQAASSVLGQRWFLYPLKPLAYLVISDTWSAKDEFEKTPILPALFFHGTADAVIDIKQGQENFKLWPGPKAFFIQQGGQHTSAFADEKFKASKEILLNCIDETFKQNFSNCEKMNK